MADTLSRTVYNEEAVLYRCSQARQSEPDPFVFPAHRLHCELNSPALSNYKVAGPR